MNYHFLDHKSTKMINYHFESDRSIKTSNQNIFRLIYKKFYQKKFVIENKLSISDQRGKWIHYPELPKVTSYTLKC